jgi:hypothetical protein
VGTFHFFVTNLVCLGLTCVFPKHISVNKPPSADLVQPFLLENTIRVLTMLTAPANVVANISCHVHFRWFKAQMVCIEAVSIMTQMRQIDFVKLA